MPLTVTTITGLAKNYIDVFFRRKWFLIVPTLLFSALGFAWSFFIPPMYKSTAIILIQEEKATNPIISGLALSSTVKERINTLIKILLSKPVLQEVIKQVGIDRNLTPSQRNYIISLLRKNIRINLLGGSILKIECHFRNPVLAQKIASAVSEIFIHKNLELQMRETDVGIEFLEKQRDIYAKKLADAERALREFKTKYQNVLLKSTSEKISKILGSPVMINAEILKYTDYKQNLIDLNLRLKELMAKRDKIKEMLEQESMYVVSERSFDPIIRELKSILAQKQLQLARLQIDSTPDHPAVKRLKKEIEELKQQIDKKLQENPTIETKEVLNPVYQELKKKLNDVESEIDSIKTKIKLTQIYLEDHAQKIKMIPIWEEQLAALQRDYEINSQIYSQITQKLETAYITRRLELEEKGTHFKVVESPEIPERPFKPNRKLMTFGGFIVGLLIGVGLVFVVEVTDHSFTDVNQLRNFLDIPVIGYVSQILMPEEAKELKAKRLFYLTLFIIFIIFIIVGAVIRYFLWIRK